MQNERVNKAYMSCVIAFTTLVLAVSDIQLPVVCQGWRAGAQKVVLPSEIFDYMDGAGELYLAYRFKKLYVREYSKPNEPEIVCELYQMSSSADAFGLFTYDCTGERLDLGQDAVYSDGLLLAWHGYYFIRILAERETPESKLCVIELARQVVKMCGARGRPPEALQWLPAQNLDKESIKYFHTHTCLNYFYFLSTRNLLNLSVDTEAVLGNYVNEKGKAVVLVISYPGEQNAVDAWDQFRKVYLEGLKPSGKYSLAELENGKWFGGTRVGKRLLLVLEASTRDECLELIERMVVCNTGKGGAGR